MVRPMSKKQFWDILTGPANKGCWNCKNKLPIRSACPLYETEECFAWLKIDAMYGLNSYEDVLLDNRELILAHWEWDGSK